LAPLAREPCEQATPPSHIEEAYNLKIHFLTRETFLDVVVMCQVRILMVKLYREKYPTFRIFGDRFSSRFSEYVFQYCRMAETNSPMCSVLGFKRHLRHFHLMIDMAVTSGLKFPPSKRGVPNDISRVDLDKHSVPAGWHLSDAEICTILDKAVEVTNGIGTGDCTKWWMGILDCPDVVTTNLRNSKEFFSAPVKHFKPDDLWGVGVGAAPHADDAPADAPHREDDDDVVEIEVIDVNEEKDATTIFGRLVERSGQYGSSSGCGGDQMKFVRDMCDKLKKFNNELIRLAQDRKFRFRVTKVFHGQAKGIDDADKWDYYSDDDDALLVVKRGSTEHFAIGNIHEIIVMNQVPVDKSNLTAGDALRNGEPKERIPLRFEPNRVAMLMKLYDEVDKDGNVVPGYGNAAQKYYRLPLQAECAPDYWLSESLLGHVRMQPVEHIKDWAFSRMYKEKAASDRADVIAEYRNG
jgi:hypothetical protein